MRKRRPLAVFDTQAATLRKELADKLVKLGLLTQTQADAMATMTENGHGGMMKGGMMGGREHGGGHRFGNNSGDADGDAGRIFRNRHIGVEAPWFLLLPVLRPGCDREPNMKPFQENGDALRHPRFFDIPAVPSDTWLLHRVSGCFIR